MAEDFTAEDAALEDLKAEIASLGTEVDTLLSDLLAAQATGNQPAIDAATQALRDRIAEIKAIETRDMPPGP
jgi:hypothetical protein